MHPLTRLVERKLQLLFPDSAGRSRAAKELQRCSKAAYPNIERLQLAVLKLLEHFDRDILRAVDGAIEDPEDIIGWAERPNRSKERMENVKLTPQREAELETADWQQYHVWLAQGLK